MRILREREAYVFLGLGLGDSTDVAKPSGQPLGSFLQLALAVARNQPEWLRQIAIVEDINKRKLSNCAGEIAKRAGIACRELFNRNIVPSLRNTHCHTLIGGLRRVEP